MKSTPGTDSAGICACSLSIRLFLPARNDLDGAPEKRKAITKRLLKGVLLLAVLGVILLLGRIVAGYLLREETPVAEDVERIAAEGKLAALMGLEGGHAIESDLETLRGFYDAGIRYMTLTHTCSHGWADASGDVDDPDAAHHGGLSNFGREVVRRMNRLGMIVNVAHVSDDTFWEVLEVTQAHSGTAL